MAKSRLRRGKRIEKVIYLQRTIGIKVKNPKDKGYICSNSIAEIFSNAGVNLTPGIHPLRTSVTDLLQSKKLKPVNE